MLVACFVDCPSMNSATEVYKMNVDSYVFRSEWYIFGGNSALALMLLREVPEVDLCVNAICSARRYNVLRLYRLLRV